MKKLNKVSLLLASAALATAASAGVPAANGGSVVDNWQNGTGEYVWRNGTNELCWRDANWTPATAAVGCDGALVRAAAPAPAPVTSAPTAAVPMAAPAPAMAAAPAVAAAPAPRPSVQHAGAPTAQARTGAILRDQPTPNGPVAQVMPSGGAVDLLQRVYNTTGGWWYVRTVKGSGWINENELWLNTQ